MPCITSHSSRSSHGSHTQFQSRELANRALNCHVTAWAKPCNFPSRDLNDYHTAWHKLWFPFEAVTPTPSSRLAKKLCNPPKLWLHFFFHGLPETMINPPSCGSNSHCIAFIKPWPFKLKLWFIILRRDLVSWLARSHDSSIYHMACTKPWPSQIASRASKVNVTAWHK